MACTDFSWKDLLTFEWMIDKPQEGAPELTEAQKTMQKAAVRAVARFAANREDCRRVLILDEFREMYAQPRCEVGCDNCDEHRTAELRDVTAEALQFLKFVKSVQGVDPRVTETTLVKAFKGHALKDIRAKGLDQLPLAGAGRDIDLSLLERLANYLSRVDALQPFEYTAPGNRFSNTYTKVRICQLKIPHRGLTFCSCWYHSLATSLKNTWRASTR
jgi:superfamily II DNA helicase RecQ